MQDVDNHFQNFSFSELRYNFTNVTLIRVKQKKKKNITTINYPYDNYAQTVLNLDDEDEDIVEVIPIYPEEGLNNQDELALDKEVLNNQDDSAYYFFNSLKLGVDKEESEKNKYSITNKIVMPPLLYKNFTEDQIKNLLNK
ncbi:hypothetical protein HK099_002844, partial [Clydaea vesicula]